MRALIQRVSRASVSVDGKIISAIEGGLLVFVGIAPLDHDSDVQWLARKVVQMRLFLDEEGKMNRSVLEAGGQVLLVSQFTLFASTKKGNRPGFSAAGSPDEAQLLIQRLADAMRQEGADVALGQFGAHMQVDLINDGPVTIWMDTRMPE
jgi:D-tyrosyl-tRNA(Tyr) deacylase